MATDYIKIENKKDCIDVKVNGQITDENSLKLVEEIKNASEAGIKKLNFYINSYGGSVKGAYDIMEAVKTYNMSTTATNTGFAISAASILLASADKSYAFNYSTALIHNPSLSNKKLEDAEGSTKEFLNKIKDGIIAVYKNRMTISNEEIDTMMNNETSLNADEQKNIGLVDEVINKNKQPIFSNELNLLEIFNIYDEFNKKEEEEMEINDKLMSENEALKLEIENLKKEKRDLDVEKFIVENKFEDKKELVKESVDKYGIDILDLLVNFKVEAVVETVIDNDLKDKIIDIVNDANKIIDGIIENSEKVIDKTKMADEYFSLNADKEKVESLKEENIYLYNELKEIYFNS